MAKKLLLGVFGLIVVVVAVLLVSDSIFKSQIRSMVNADGPYTVGWHATRVTLHGRETGVAMWYPATQTPDESPLTMPMRTDAPAPPDTRQAPYPLIIFSHGFGACGNQSVFYTVNLASHGYVVVAADHLDSTLCHIDREPEVTPTDIAVAFFSGWREKGKMDIGATLQNIFTDWDFEKNPPWLVRPREAAALIDVVLAWNQDATSPLQGMIDPSRIGMSGHSAGGSTTLNLGGFGMFCDAPQDPDHWFNPCDNEEVRANPFLFKDTRVRAILPLAPGMGGATLARAAQTMTLPMMLITGDFYEFEVPFEPLKEFYDHYAGPRYLILLKDTDHLTVGDAFAEMGLPGMHLLFPGARSNMRPKMQAYKDYSIAFFDKYLKGYSSKPGILKEPSNDFVQLWSDPAE